jgi:hypothetical protein
MSWYSASGWIVFPGERCGRQWGGHGVSLFEMIPIMTLELRKVSMVDEGLFDVLLVVLCAQPSSLYPCFHCCLMTTTTHHGPEHR